MAQISEFTIVTYERKPGHWRAAFTRKVASETARGDRLRSTVTPIDYGSETEAGLAAEKMIKKL
jgi:hypothetical protein